MKEKVKVTGHHGGGADKETLNFYRDIDTAIINAQREYIKENIVDDSIKLPGQFNVAIAVKGGEHFFFCEFCAEAGDWDRALLYCSRDAARKVFATGTIDSSEVVDHLSLTSSSDFITIDAANEEYL